MKTAILLLIGITMAFLCHSYAAPRFTYPLGRAWQVENTNDSGDGSLRQTIAGAQTGDLITFDPALTGQAIGLTSGSLLIDKSLEIRGLGQDVITISRTTTSRFRILDIQAGVLLLSDLTISNGYADGSFGGGILNRSTTVVRRCRITGNTSDAGDGGGGIWNTGDLRLEQSTVDNNQAIFTVGFPVGFGGGIKTSGVLTLFQSVVTDNEAALRGGGIYCNGSLVIIQSTVSDNSAPEGANIYGCAQRPWKIK